MQLAKESVEATLQAAHIEYRKQACNFFDCGWTDLPKIQQLQQEIPKQKEIEELQRKTAEDKLALSKLEDEKNKLQQESLRLTATKNGSLSMCFWLCWVGMIELETKVRSLQVDCNFHIRKYEDERANAEQNQVLSSILQSD